MKTSIIIPVYNEEATIKQVLEVIKTVEMDKEIIVVCPQHSQAYASDKVVAVGIEAGRAHDDEV